MLDAVVLDLGELLVGGTVLPIAATVTDIGIDYGARGEGGWRREVGQFMIYDWRFWI